jgi:hypothetical protein
MGRAHAHSPAPAGPPSGRTAKPRRAFGDPVAAPAVNPGFEPPPFTNRVNLNLPLHVVMPDDAIVAAGKMVFHAVGDTGGVNDGAIVQTPRGAAGWPTIAHVGTGRPEAAAWPTTRGPRRGGLRGDSRLASSSYSCAVKSNWPRPVLVNRDWAPLVWHSRSRAL